VTQNYYHRQIARAVQRVRWVQRLVGVLEAAVVFLAGLGVCALVLTLLAGPLSGHERARVVALLVGLLAPSLIAFAWLMRTPSLRRTRVQCALAVEQACGVPHNEVINALQLGEEIGSPQTSAAGVAGGLVDSLVRRVGVEMDSMQLMRSVDGRRLRRATIALLAIAFAADLAWLASPGTFKEAWLALLSPGGVFHGVARRRVDEWDRPSVGDISLTYHYPLYTGRRPRTVANASGHIRALKGTEVEIRAATNAQLREAVLLLSNGQQAPLQVTPSGESDDAGAVLSGRLIVIEDGSYRFRLRPVQGRPVTCEDRYSINVEPDRVPRVEIVRGEDDQGNVTKVAEQEEVELRYRVRDDFGIAKVRLVFKRDGKEERVRLKSFTPARKRHSDTYLWKLASLSLKPGERVAYHLEAEDNDSVSGPNVGRSQTRFLEVFSARGKHRELVEFEEMLRKTMTHLLGDELVMPPAAAEYAQSAERLFMAQDNIAARRSAVLALMDRITTLMQQDSLSNYAYYQALQNMGSRLKRLSTRREMVLAALKRIAARGALPAGAVGKITEVQDDEIRELETDLIFLAAVIQQQRLAEIRHRAEELLTRQRSIADLLEQLASDPNTDLADQARTLLEQVQQMLAEMLAEMAKMASQIPQEFVNADALANAAKPEMADALKEMMEAMERGDMKAALEAAQRMMEQLSKLMDSMEQASQQYADNRYGEQLKQLAQMQKEIGELEQQEHRLAEKTNEIKKAAQRRLFGLIKRSLEEFFSKQLKRLAQATDALRAVADATDDDPMIGQYQVAFKAYLALIESQAKILAQMSEAKDTKQGKALFETLRATEGRMQKLVEAVRRGPILRVLCMISHALTTRLDVAHKLKQALEAWDVGESLPLAEQLAAQTREWQGRVEAASKSDAIGPGERQRGLHALPHLRTAKELTGKIADDLRKLRQQLDSMRQQTLTNDETAELQELAGQQDQIQEQTRALRERAEQAAAKMPFMCPRTCRKLGGAASSMQRAASKLRGSRVGSALAAERDAAAQLSEAKRMMEEAQQMCEQGLMGGCMPMPGGLQRGRRGRRPDLGKVEIPSEDAHRVPKEFRQDIIDAMKHGLPERFREINREYYRKLLE